MSFTDQLFPTNKRDFAGKRWLKISLRTLHLIGLAGIGGAFFYPVETAQWLPYLWLTLLSGLAMMGVEIGSHGIWLLQLRGLTILFKLGLLAYVFWANESADIIIVLAVVAISGVISHAPGKVRYFSPFYGRAIQTSSWSWADGSRKTENGGV